MRKIIGGGVLAFGLVALAIWGRADHAAKIEAGIGDAAQQVVAGATHGVEARVSGRDIALSGLADSPEERTALIAAAEAVPGQRSVTAEDLRSLARADPYVTEFSKAEDGTLSASGHIPREDLRAGFDAALGGAQDALTLAAGAPQDWQRLMQAGAAALAAMEQGSARLDAGKLVISGTVLGPDQHIALLDALGDLPDAAWEDRVELLDDGAAPAYRFDWSAATGGSLSGKLPLGVTPDAVQAALGLSALDAGDTTLARIGTPGDTGLFAKVKGLLAGLETLRLSVTPDGAEARAGMPQGVDLAGAQATLAAALGPQVALAVETAPAGAEDGAERLNAATGRRERLSGGFWLAVPDFAPSVETCTAATDAVLAGATVNFVSGSAELDRDALAILNDLGSIIRECATVAGLRAEIGGHTDSSGDPAGNRRLSQLRAAAVRQALIDRGAPRAALVSRGYGDTQPVASNDTDDGKAQNRRTTIIWAQ